jgi:hypothetical protein
MENDETLYCHAVVTYYYSKNSKTVDATPRTARCTFAALPLDSTGETAYGVAWTSPTDQFRKKVGRSIANRRLEGRLEGPRGVTLVLGDSYEGFWLTVFGASMGHSPSRWTITDINFFSKNKQVDATV